jgi:hypothetical protein
MATHNSWNAADTLAINDPAEYERLLHSYFTLLGDDLPWWRRCSEADHPQWKQCVADSAVEVAEQSDIPREWLCDALDIENALPITRRRIMRLSRERLAERRVA